MSVNGINIIPPHLEITASVTKQMFDLKRNVMDKLLSSMIMPGMNVNMNQTNFEYLDLYKGNLIDIYA